MIESREKLLHELEHMAEVINDYDDLLNVDCESWVVLDALELLKAQPEIVRCKDCKYWSKEHDQNCMIKQGWFPVKPDWFCADGERQ